MTRPPTTLEQVEVSRLVRPARALRAKIDLAKIDALAASIRAVGQLEPLLDDGDRYEIVAGDRRFLTLEITSVRVERVQSISEEDARAEGVDALMPGRGVVPATSAPRPIGERERVAARCQDRTSSRGSGSAP